MTVLVWLLAGAIALLAGWLALGATAPAREGGSEVQEVVMRIERGFDPETIVLQRGLPAKIRVLREEDTDETSELFIPRFAVHRKIPPFRTTTIDIDPDEAGVFGFHSRGSMFEGRIIVVE